MITSKLMASALLARSLVTNEMPEAKRLDLMKPHFFPSPGSMIEVLPHDRYNRLEKDALDYSGYIEVNPPKGHCFTITLDKSLPDQVTCRKRSLRFRLHQLDEAGNLNWYIKTGPEDFGVNYRWPSPYRRAQFLEEGTVSPTFHPTRRCTAQNGANERRIILELMDGRKWEITLPATDVPTGQQGRFPNLYIPDLPRQERTITEQDGEKIIDPMAHLAEKKNQPSTNRPWLIPELNAFILPGENVRFNGQPTPTGTRSSCRYRYDGAPHDPHSGMIECHDIDRYTRIYSPLTCIKQLLRK